MRKGGLAAWSIHHPVSTLMLTLTVIVLGVFAAGRLATDLLPHLIYPQISVRVLDPGVSATIMEDSITRQLEEQLAITEDAIGVESTTEEGNTRVNLSFEYGKDIDVALRDASTRLDRAKRFLPTTIDPPIIYKMDPSQIPVMEFIVNSSLRDPVALRYWTDYVFGRRFVNLPGVAAVEVGGGLEREIHVLPDQRRLAGLGLSMESIIQAIKKGNEDTPSGRLLMSQQEYSSRTSGRLTSVEAIAGLPISLPGGQSIPLSDMAQVVDTHEDERIRARFNGIPGVKLSIQKQPEANTVDVAELVKSRLDWMQANDLIPEDIRIDAVSDQSIYVKQSLNNAQLAALSGAALAMIVVYVFIGNVRGTLIIGSAIPISIMITFVLMEMGGLTFNIMTLGGLALGIGMLIDNTIVMLENIARHKKQAFEARTHQDNEKIAAVEAASEVNSAIVAATSTNLAAVLPFLFIGGLVGLMFRELIFTISAAIIGSLVVAITLVPSLAAQMSGESRGVIHAWVDQLVKKAQTFYVAVLDTILTVPWRVIMAMAAALVISYWFGFDTDKQEYLPAMDDGRISINITTDTGVSLDELDQRAIVVENIINKQKAVEGVFTLVGGRIFGRTERQTSNATSISVQLVPLSERNISSQQWVKQFQKDLNKAEIAGIKVRARVSGIRGVRTSSSDDDVSIRVEGPQLDILARIGEDLTVKLQGTPGLRSIKHSMEDRLQEFAIKVDRKRAVELGIDVAEIGRAMRIALDGIVVSDFLDGDRSYNIRVRLPRRDIDSPVALGSVLLFGEITGRPAIYLRDVAETELLPVPASIMRENQARIVEVSGSLTGDNTLGEVMQVVRQRVAEYKLPKGYNLYYSGTDVTLKQGKNTAATLLFLALFLVFVVMAIQYESLKNPTVIMVCVPFSLVGVSIGLMVTDLNISMPVWLGIIMLVGIVVNNAIVLVEYIEIMREKGLPMKQAIMEAGRLRLRPILMTTLTTVVGMLPLAIGVGEGSEMLQPLAVTIVGGLSFSLLVSLLLVPAVYWVMRQSSSDQAPQNKLNFAED
ncbi:MAG: efflux RND transporter permease subunit [Gammaproteobacteria bacterium]|nr:efflux RND transporter permease subunit [Gammaproteobacteria bacterium]